MSKYSDKTFEKILDDMCRRVKECSTMEGSFIYTALAPFAMELALLYLQLEQDEKNGFADTADYEHLKKLALDRGIIPNSATHAVGIGKFDVEIPVGSKFSINTYSFISGDQITGKQDGYFYYKMTSEQTGTEVNTVIGKLTAITFIRNLNYAYLTEITIPAEDDEEIESFRSRYFETFNKKSFGGNKSDYIDKINSFNGVGGCKVYPLWNGGGTVKIIIINSNYEMPSPTLVQQIQNEIDPSLDGEGSGYAPIGHKVTIESVSRKTIKVGVSIQLDGSKTFETIKNDLMIAINNYFHSLSKTWDSNEYLTVRIAQVTTALLNVSGVIDVTKCLLNDGTGNIELTDIEIPYLSDVEEIVES